MRNLPVVLDGYSLMVSEAPEAKTYEDENGKVTMATDVDGNQMFVVSLFAKRKASGDGARRGKGEEIRVTLEVDPGVEFSDGDYVELVNPRISPYQMTNGKGAITNSGISFRANTVKAVGTASYAA